MRAKSESVSRQQDEPVHIHVHALDNLRFIRQTMERSTSFTAVPGWGTVGMGGIALVGAVVAHYMPSQEAWLTAWMITAAVALSVGAAAMLRKARMINESVFEGAGRRFALGMMPTDLAAVALTVVMARLGLFGIMPGMWLLLYGAGVVTAGAFSVKVVPAMGFCFMALGLAALALPLHWGSTWMALGFGGVHVVFGLIIARKHGG